MRPLLMLALAAGAAAQTPPSFEVASIKPAVLPSGPMRRGNRALGDRVDFQFVTLRYCIAFAYGVKDYQISAPAWLNDSHWEIVAKAPAGAKAEDLPAMLQTLLADRFQLQVHRESREFSGLVLVVGKGGPKLTPAAADGPVEFNRTFRFGGGGKVESPSLSMPALAAMISTTMARPVTDETGIAGNYHIAFEYSAQESALGGTTMARPGPPPADVEPGVSIFTSIQALGLKLEPRKMPLQVIVVDHAAKAPAAN